MSGIQIRKLHQTLVGVLVALMSSQSAYTVPMRHKENPQVKSRQITQSTRGTNCALEPLRNDLFWLRGGRARAKKPERS